MTAAGQNMAATTSLVEDTVGLIRNLASTGDLPRELKTAPLTAETTLESLALDSLAKMTLLVALDEYYGVYIPDDVVTADTTIGSLVTGVATAKGLAP